MAAKGADNALLPVSKILHQSVMGGMYVGMGALLSMVVAGNCGGLAKENPGLQKLLSDKKVRTRDFHYHTFAVRDLLM